MRTHLHLKLETQTCEDVAPELQLHMDLFAVKKMTRCNVKIENEYFSYNKS